MKGEADQRGRREIDLFIEVIRVSPRCRIHLSSGAAVGGLCNICFIPKADCLPCQVGFKPKPKPALEIVSMSDSETIGKLTVALSCDTPPTPRV